MSTRTYIKSPLAEMALSAQFVPASSFQAVHLGQFMQRHQDRFPINLTHPPMETVFETESGTEIRQEMNFLTSVEIPRVWGITSDHSLLLQFQSNRIVLNWRRTENGSEYPTFDAISKDFFSLLEDLEVFFVGNFSHGPAFNQAEVVYINIVEPPNRDISEVGVVFPSLVSSVAPSGGIALDGFHQTTSRILRSVQGRLHVAYSAIKRPNLPGNDFRFELIARGGNELKNRSAVENWMDLAHTEITAHFEETTNRAFRTENWRPNDSVVS